MCDYGRIIEKWTRNTKQGTKLASRDRFSSFESSSDDLSTIRILFNSVQAFYFCIFSRKQWKQSHAKTASESMECWISFFFDAVCLLASEWLEFSGNQGRFHSRVTPSCKLIHHMACELSEKSLSLFVWASSKSSPFAHQSTLRRIYGYWRFLSQSPAKSFMPEHNEKRLCMSTMNDRIRPPLNLSCA